MSPGADNTPDWDEVRAMSAAAGEPDPMMPPNVGEDFLQRMKDAEAQVAAFLIDGNPDHLVHRSPEAKASDAIKALAPERDLNLGTRIFKCDYQALRLTLIQAACPVVCRGHLDGGEDWHQLCIDKAEAALVALEVADA